MDKKVADLINAQINKELYSAYLYLDFANYFERRGLEGFANWYTIQSQEERDHAMLMYRFMINNDSTVTFEAVAKPTHDCKSDMDILNAGLAHEKFITASINDIYDVAYSVKDFRTMQFLDWFVKEQGEEEKNALDLVTKYELFGSDAKGLYMLDNELKARVYNAPSLVL